MKKIVVILAGFVMLQACNPSNENSGESGAVNDGFEGVGDNNGALPGDTAHFSDTLNSSIDTAADDHRVDIEQRDSTRR